MPKSQIRKVGKIYRDKMGGIWGTQCNFFACIPQNNRIVVKHFMC